MKSKAPKPVQHVEALKRAITGSTYDRLAATIQTKEALERAKHDHGLSDQALRYAFALCDARGYGLGGPRQPDMAIYQRLFDNKDRDRGQGRFIGYELIDDGDVYGLEADDLDYLIDRLLKIAEKLADEVANPPPPTRLASEVFPAWQLAHEAVRKAAKMLKGFKMRDVPRGRIADIIRLIPPRPGMTLEVARSKSRKLATLCRTDESIGDLFELAVELEESRGRERIEIGEPPPKPSRDALRKRQARAAGRVKPRAKRPPRTLLQEVESRRKAVNTRKAAFAALKPDLLSLSWHQARKSLELAETALKTFEKRLSSQSR